MAGMENGCWNGKKSELKWRGGGTLLGRARKQYCSYLSKAVIHPLGDTFNTSKWEV